MNRESFTNALHNAHRCLKPQFLKSRFLTTTAPILLLIALLGTELAPAFGQSAEPEAPHKKNLYLPAIYDTRPYCTRHAPQHIFGVQMYGNTGRRSAFHNALLTSGAAWVRVPLDWEPIEPTNTTPDKYKWRTADNAVGASNYACIETILTFGTAPGWFTNIPNGVIDESKFPEVAEFLTALVERYDGDGINDATSHPIVNYIELYNEPDGGPIPNAGNFSTWGNNGAAYAKLLAAVVPKMRQANPNVKVLLGGLAYDSFTTDTPPGNFVRKFLDDVIAAGGGDYFDIMNFHYYPAFYRAWTDKPPGLLEKTNALRQKMNDLGVPGKEFMITETGWHNNDDPDIPSNDQEQMFYTVQLMTQSKAAGLKAMIYFALSDPFDNLSMGLFTANIPPVPKKALATYQMMVELLGPAAFVKLERITPDSNDKSRVVDVYHFTDASHNRKVYIIWMYSSRENDSHTFYIPGERATVHTIADERSTLLDTDDNKDDGFFKIRATANPIILEVTQ